jgi:lipoate-protein ligase A
MPRNIKIYQNKVLNYNKAANKTTVNYQSTKKVPGGKLLRVKVQADEKITAVSITGDFFLHPEESLQTIEKSLIGLPTQTPENILAEKIHSALAEQKANFIGVSAEDIAQTLVEAINQPVTAKPE